MPNRPRTTRNPFPTGWKRAVSWFLSVAKRLGYPHSSTSIFISKKKYSILVIEILYSIQISPAPVLPLSHTLYPLFHILFPFLPLPLSQQLSLSLATVFSVAPRVRYLWRCPVRVVRSRVLCRRAVRARATLPAPAGLFPGVRCR
jgi:hypothetical protein